MLPRGGSSRYLPARGGLVRRASATLAASHPLVDDTGEQLGIARAPARFQQPAEPDSETGHTEPPRVAIAATASKVLAGRHDRPMAG